MLLGKEKRILPEVPKDELEALKVFYKHFFEIRIEETEVSKSQMKLKEFPEIFYVDPEIPEEIIVLVMCQHFPTITALYTNISSLISKEIENSRYGGWIEIKNDSNQSTKNGITLRERLLIELYYFWKYKKHFETSTMTLCDGSRHLDGATPFTCWDGAMFWINWCEPPHTADNLRFREIINL